MSILKKILLQAHKITGSAMSILFLMWCLTGFVLIYVGFPHASRQARFENLSFLNNEEMAKIQPLPDVYSGKVELENYNNLPVYRIYTGKKNQTVINALTLKPIKVFTKSEAKHTAEQFTTSWVCKIDSVNELDSWIPWQYYTPLLPFYKCYLSDDEHTVIYVSAKSGTIVQQTTRKTRWLGRVGAIPHWIYFKQLHTHIQLRKQTVLWLGVVGIIVCVTGIWFGIFRLKRDQNKHISGITVYKKWWLKWHHISGFVFGVFLIVFMLSGVFYVTGVSGWISKKEKSSTLLSKWNKGTSQGYCIYPQQVWGWISPKKGIRKIGWNVYMNRSVVEIYYNNYKNPKVYYVSENNQLQNNEVSENEIKKQAQQIFKTSNIQLSTQKHFDYYYENGSMFHHPLPVYKLELKNQYNSVLYINPASGKAIAYIDNNKKVHLWLTKALHKFNFPFLQTHNGLRIAILIFVLLGCLFLSVTSVVLSIRWIKRIKK